MAPRASEAVLEVGCGTGLVVELLCERLTRGHVTAIDRSRAMVVKARQRNRACISVGRAVIRQLALSKADFPQASFHRALAVNVNLFWLDPGSELAVLRRILHPGGLLCLVYQPPSASRISHVAASCSEFLGLHGFRRVRVVTAELPSGPAVSIRAFTRAT